MATADTASVEVELMVLVDVASPTPGEITGPAEDQVRLTSKQSPSDPIGHDDGQGPLFRHRVGTQAVTLRQVVTWIVITILVLALSVVAVLYGLGPLSHERAQRTSMAAYRLALTHAAAETDGLGGVQVPTQPPVTGTTVGIVEIPALGLEQTVTEGVGPVQTISGPGHVPGTAGLGQPGNSAVVARRSGFGGPFGDLDQLHRGDQIVVTTTEGRSLYLVRQVHTVTLTDKLYGPTPDDQLTLVTSATSVPWNTTRATVATARMQGRPFAPTPQQSRSPSQVGNAGDPSSLPLLILALLALGGAIVGAVVLYRRTSLRSAYLLTTAPLIVFTILGAEAASRLFPAWL